MELKQALQTALEFEKKGHSIYEETANKTKNPIVAKTFRYLSNQELIHIEEIKEYIEKLNNSHKIELKGDNLKQTQEFFNTTITQFKEKTELSDDDLKAHETGLILERRAYDFYKEQHDNSTDEETKKFFKWIMTQENAHYEFIRRAYDFIKDPVAFYSEEEQWMVDGG
ncbi:MAG: ferritin family protein [Nanoarchaeota archaeon]|nr:ferritin family protein [Nanoarchaeota archaeon]MBU1005713.1 ferritin family protein [Nanoarchaeota archaeon]MBU1945602.1 ferritin family protein [Nanoarchaeota archaeon]